MSAASVMRRRLSNSGLTAPRLRAPAEIVGHHGALQAQDYGPAKWSVGQRSEGLTDEDLDRALSEGAIVRTHVLRPTWHFVAGADLRWLQGLTAARVQSRNARRYRELGLDARTLARATTRIASALAGGNRLTRKEIAQVLEGHRIDTSGQRIAYMVMHCELEAVICSGGLRGKQQTYALVEEHVSAGRDLTGDDALAELIRRYLGSHGPAAVADLAWWSSLTTSSINRGLELLDAEVSRELVGDVVLWSLAGEPAPARPRGVHLLQAYDEIVVGYTQSRFLGDPGAGEMARRRRDRTVPTGFVLFDGNLAGNWRRRTTRAGVAVELDLFDRLPVRARRPLAAAAGDLGRFLDAEVRLADLPAP